MERIYAVCGVVMLVAALLGSLAGTARASGDCGNQRASQVGASQECIGQTKVCGLGLVVFGVGGSIVGGDCCTNTEFTPAHQECKGIDNFGTNCVPDAPMPVTCEKCRCGGLVIPWIETGFPTECKCKAEVPCGTVEDFATVSC